MAPYENPTSDLADAVHNFGLEMEHSFPGFREGLADWKAKIEDCVQDFSEKRIARNAALRNEVVMG